MITRTMTITVCEVLCCDVLEGDTIIEEVKVPRTYKTDEQLMKVVRPLVETPEIKPVHIKSKRVEETLYGMTEAEFLKYAKILPPRTPQKETPKDKKKPAKKPLKEKKQYDYN